ncbi:hypothetical protein KR026_002481 [Drosophila bipectinata]|nr:hypothetical protein KR026_002481 [Drosophila bipectinata]
MGDTNNASYRNERRKFAMITYLITAVAMIVALLEWCLFHFVDPIHSFFTDYYWIGSIFVTIGLLLLVVFIFFEVLRFNKMINWLFALLIFEFVVLGMAPLITRQYRYQFLFSFLIWAIVLVIFILVGSFLPLDLTLDVVVLFVIAVISIICAMHFLMFYLVFNMPYSFIVVRIFIVISIWMFVMYHAQIINGGRFAEMRTKDYFLGALILFLDFLLMYLFSFQLAPKWSDACDKERMDYLIIFKNSTTNGYTASRTERMFDPVEGE